MNPRFRAVALCLFAAICFDAFGQAANFRDAAESINNTIRTHHYRPAELDSEAYRQIEAQVVALGEKSTSANEFMSGFNALWRKGPFSHVGLRKAEEPAADRIARIDTSRRRRRRDARVERLHRHSDGHDHERRRHDQGDRCGLW